MVSSPAQGFLPASMNRPLASLNFCPLVILSNNVNWQPNLCLFLGTSHYYLHTLKKSWPVTGTCPGRHCTSRHLTPPGWWCPRDYFSPMNGRSDVSIFCVYAYKENVSKWSSPLSLSLAQVCEPRVNMQLKQPPREEPRSHLERN